VTPFAFLTLAFHEKTEVIDLKPAEVFVRVDIREVLATRPRLDNPPGT
jgi:hypothetical protein